MATKSQPYPNVTLIKLTKSEKVQLIARLAADVAEEDILHSDGTEAIPYGSLLQVKVTDEVGDVSILRFE